MGDSEHDDIDPDPEETRKKVSITLLHVHIYPRRFVPEPVFSYLHTLLQYLFFFKNIRDVIDCYWQVQKDIMAERRKVAKAKQKLETARRKRSRDLAKTTAALSIAAL